MSSASALPQRRCRVLFLHGWGSNAAAFSGRVARGLGRKLPPSAFALTFLDGPVELPPLPRDGDEEEGAAGAGAAASAAAEADAANKNRAWFTYNATPEDAERTRADALSPDARDYLRWPEARKLIASAWAAEGPFDAVLGFSQGAIAAHQLLREIEHLRGAGEAAARAAGYAGDAELALLQSPPRCAVLASGRTSRHVWPAVAENAPLSTPSLHVISEADDRIPFALQLELLGAFTGAEALRHDKGHVLPSTAAPASAIAAFLLKHVA